MTVRLSETLTQYLADLDAYRKVAILFEHATHFVIRKGVMLTMTPLAPMQEQSFPLLCLVLGTMRKPLFSLAIHEAPRSQQILSDFLCLYMTSAAKAEPSINASFIPRNTLRSSFKWQSLTNILRGVDRDVSILSAKGSRIYYHTRLRRSGTPFRWFNLLTHPGMQT
jgi:hypothetical protein